jgi:hypothetical protein
MKEPTKKRRQTHQDNLARNLARNLAITKDLPAEDLLNEILGDPEQLRTQTYTQNNLVLLPQVSITMGLQPQIETIKNKLNDRIELEQDLHGLYKDFYQNLISPYIYTATRP